MLWKEFIDHLVVSEGTKVTKPNLIEPEVRYVAWPIGAGLGRIFCFSTNETKVHILDYVKVDVSGRVLFPSSSKQKGTKDTWSLQVTCDNELLIKAGLMQYLYLWFMEHEKKFEWGGGGGGQ